MTNKHVKVAGMLYSVSEVEYVIIDGSVNYAGSCDYNNTHIEIREDLPQARKDETFVHELMHAAFYEAGYDEHDEEMIDRVSKVWHQVLKDNPSLFGVLHNE